MQSENAELSEFLLVARNFCSFIESTKPETPVEFLSNVHKLLLQLYQLGKSLPEASTSDSDFADLLTDSDFKIVLENISRRSPFQYYWIIIDPFNFNDTNQQL